MNPNTTPIRIPAGTVVAVGRNAAGKVEWSTLELSADAYVEAVRAEDGCWNYSLGRFVYSVSAGCAEVLARAGEPSTWYTAVSPDGYSLGLGADPEQPLVEATDYNGGERPECTVYPCDHFTAQEILETCGAVRLAVVGGRAVLASSQVKVAEDGQILGDSPLADTARDIAMTTPLADLDESDEPAEEEAAGLTLAEWREAVTAATVSLRRRQGGGRRFVIVAEVVLHHAGGGDEHGVGELSEALSAALSGGVELGNLHVVEGHHPSGEYLIHWQSATATVVGSR